MRDVVDAISAQDAATAVMTIDEIDRLVWNNRASIASEISEIYRFLAQMNEYVGSPSKSVILLERGISLVEAQGGQDSAAHFMLRADLTNALLFAGNGAMAITLGEELKETLATQKLDTTAYAFKNQVTLGSAYAQAGQIEAAVDAYESALSKSGESARDPMLELIARKGLAVFLVQVNRADDAVLQSERGYAFATAQYGANSAYALDFQVDLAFALIAKNDTIEAWNILDAAFREALRSLGPDHAVTQRAAENMAFFRGTQPVEPAAQSEGQSNLEQLADLEAAALEARARGDQQRLETVLLSIADLTRISPGVELGRHAEALEELVDFYSTPEHDPQRAPHFLNAAISVLEHDLGENHLITLRMKRFGIERRMSEVANFELFVAQFGPSIMDRLRAHRRFWDGSEETASLSQAELEVFRRYAAAHGPQDDFVSKLTATLRYAEVLDDAGRHGDARRTLEDLEVTLEQQIAATGTTFQDLRVHVQRGLAQNLSAAGSYDQAMNAFHAAVPELFETLRLSHMAVDTLGDTILLMFGRSFGMDFAASAWMAHSTNAQPDPKTSDMLFEAAQIAGYGPASAAVARSGLRRLMQNPELAILADQWRDMTRLQQKDILSPDIDQDWFRVLAMENLRAAILEKAPEFYDMQVPDPVPLSDVREKGLLTPEDALIVVLPAFEFGKFAHDPKLGGLVLAITSDGFAAAPIDMGSIELTIQVAHLHAELDRRSIEEEVALRSEGTRAPLNPAVDGLDNDGRQQNQYSFSRAHDLYASIFGAADIQALIGDKKNWIIVANGAAMSIPFAALVTHPMQNSDAPSVARLREAHWLGLEHALTIVPSIDSWVSLKDRSIDIARDDGAVAYLGIGDPAFQGLETAALITASALLRSDLEARSTTLRSLPRLPGTRREVEQISELFPADRRAVLLGSDASEEGLRRLASQGVLSEARILHFATHGLLEGAFDDLGEPALALSPPVSSQSAENDGLLTASEAAALDLNAEWIILSACDTSGTDGLNGDGLGGLAQGFFTAGAQSLLVSHWRVDDLAAERLATETVRLSERGIPKAEALRRAMESLINDTSRDHTSGSFAHPSQWAPFILVGGN